MNMKILINRQGANGDVLMTSPIIRKIWNDHQGQCQIDFATQDNCAGFVEKNPYITNIIRSKPGDNLIAQYDRYIDLDLVYERNPRIHAVDAYAMAAIGHTNFDRSLELHTDDNDKAVGKKFSEILSGNYVVLHQRKWHWPSRNINPNIWEQVINKIFEETSLFVVQIGQGHDPAFEGNDRLIDARDQFSIHEIREIIANSKLFMGVDSAPGHVAAATDTNMLMLYTSVREEYRRPLRTQGKFVPIIADIECYGCHADNPAPCTTFICRRGDVDCVNRFDPAIIAAEALKLIN